MEEFARNPETGVKFEAIRKKIKKNYKALRNSGQIRVRDRDFENLVDYVLPRKFVNPPSGHFDARFEFRERNKSDLQGKRQERKGTPRVALDHWLRSGCEKNALTGEFPAKLFRQDPPEVTSPKVTHGKPTPVWQREGWNQEIGRGASSLPLGIVSKRHERKDLQDFDELFIRGLPRRQGSKKIKEMWGLEGKYANNPEGAEATRVPKCNEIKRTFYDRNGQPWKDMHDKNTLIKLYDSWAGLPSAGPSQAGLPSAGRPSQREKAEKRVLNVLLQLPEAELQALNKKVSAKNNAKRLNKTENIVKTENNIVKTENTKNIVKMEPSHARPNAGPSHARPNAGPSHAGSSHAGSSHAQKPTGKQAESRQKMKEVMKLYNRKRKSRGQWWEEYTVR